MKKIEGILTGQNRKFALVVSRFNSFLTEALEKGAIDCLTRHETREETITVAKVPGAFEIPQAAGRLARSGRYDAVICLGAVIRGSTPHFDYVCAEVSKGIGSLNLQQEVPVIFGVLTTDSIEQAVERAGTKAGNKGWDAAMTALEMVSVLQQISEETGP